MKVVSKVKNILWPFYHQEKKTTGIDFPTSRITFCNIYYVYLNNKVRKLHSCHLKLKENKRGGMREIVQNYLICYACTQSCHKYWYKIKYNDEYYSSQKLFINDFRKEPLASWERSNIWGYQISISTVSTLCKKNVFGLKRIQVGHVQLITSHVFIFHLITSFSTVPCMLGGARIKLF